LLALGSYVVATPMAMSESPFLHLLAVGMVAVMVAAYQPLRTYVEDLDHDRFFGRDYKEEDRLISTGRRLDDYEARLIKRALGASRYIVGGLFALGIWYQMLARWLGLWLPHTTNQWGWLMVGVVALTLGLPTVIMAWIYRDDFDRPWPAFEDD